jgi:cardiolipin synthase
MAAAPATTGRSKPLILIANTLSLCRLLATPFVVLLLLRAEDSPDYNRLALVLLLTLQASDILDGFLARRAMEMGARNNPFGQVLDPLADKLYIGSAYIALAATSRVEVWLAALIVVRDVLIVAGWLLLYFRAGIRTAPNVPGKIADTCQAFLVFGILIEPPGIAVTLGKIVTVLFVLISGAAYGRQLRTPSDSAA